MLGAADLGRIEELFRLSQRDESKQKLPFGGRHVIFSGSHRCKIFHINYVYVTSSHRMSLGDFYQLPPVKETPLYSETKKPNDTLGHDVWKQHFTALNTR